jgi:drug/metabolite transporter (DMT)-like permease
MALFSAALIWGSSFVIMKNAVSVFPSNYLLTFRFALSFLIFVLVFFKRLKGIDRETIAVMALIGLCLYLGYTFQTMGIKITTPGKNAFLTAAYVIIVPFLHWLVGKRTPTAKNITAAFVCLVGISMISYVSPAEFFAVGSEITLIGDVYTLIGSVFYAAHMVLVGNFSRGKDPIVITTLQFGYCTVFFGLTAVLTESMPGSIDPMVLLNLLYLAVFCTAIAMLLQNYGQKHTSPATASLLLSLEAVFGAGFSVFHGELLTARLFCGFCLVFVAILLSELEPPRRRASEA